jgi:hypothetical protein
MDHLRLVAVVLVGLFAIVLIVTILPSQLTKDVGDEPEDEEDAYGTDSIDTVADTARDDDGGVHTASDPPGHIFHWVPREPGDNSQAKSPKVDV